MASRAEFLSLLDDIETKVRQARAMLTAPTNGSSENLTLMKVRGLYGWQGNSGTDPLLHRAFDDPAKRDRCLQIAVERLESEGRPYQGRLFRRILETVIDEQSSKSRDLSHWE